MPRYSPAGINRPGSLSLSDPHQGELNMQRSIRWLIGFGVLWLSVWGFSGIPRAGLESDSESECVKCHTDVKGLIRLGWEVEKVKGKPAASAETEGEG
jgi:hypothetical protein